jgi:CarD family transcriptional regulator
MPTEFKPGDKAVYPAHGVGEVKSIETREISGNKQTFYILKILDNGMTIMVPKQNVQSVGLREIIDEDQVDEVYEILRERDITIDNQTWNRRYREYMDKIKTGSVYEIAEVLRDLSLLKFDKELSFGERKMLDTARSLLIKELALAQGEDEDEVLKKIKKIFKS